MRVWKKGFLGGVIALSWSLPCFAGLDVYAGPLGKFYKKDYLSTQAQIAKELGAEFKTVYPDGEPDWLTDKNAQKKIRAFRESLAKETKDNSPDMANWTEDTNEYLIEQLNWDCLSALIHITAHTIRQDIKRPKEFSGDYEDYPAYIESDDKGYYLGPLAILESDLYLPSNGQSFLFHETPLKDEVLITTTANLKRTLEFLNKAQWKGKARPDEWFTRGPVTDGISQEIKVSPVTGKSEIVEVEHPPVDDIALHNAEYAYGVLHKLLSYAQKHNVPIAMDG